MDKELTQPGNHLNRDWFHGNLLILYKGKAGGFVICLVSPYTLQYITILNASNRRSLTAHTVEGDSHANQTPSVL